MPPSKRKISGAPDSARAAKRSKVQEARYIETQPADPAIKNGAIDLTSFVRARQFEIKAFEESTKQSKRALATRAHQSLPRDLRRRTASHNVKRVPKRLRGRLKREMDMDKTKTIDSIKRRPRDSKGWIKKDNARVSKSRAEPVEETKREESSATKTKTVRKSGMIKPRSPKGQSDEKGELQASPRPPSKFRKRQRNKTWLPTHLWHSKRAHMTTPVKPLWRFSLPLSPTEKSYRATHRADSCRGAIAWDTSYMSTIGLSGPSKSLEALLKAIGIDGEDVWGSRGLKWRNGTRSWSGWVYEQDLVIPIAPATIVWCSSGGQATHIEKELLKDAAAAEPGTDIGNRCHKRLLLRIHPAAFLQLWNEILPIAKTQKPPVSAEDLRYEIGSIEISGPASLEALHGILSPFDSDNVSKDPHIEAWAPLAQVSKASFLPPGALLAFDVADPRLRQPLLRNKARLRVSSESESELLQLVSEWPPDNPKGAANIFSRASRLAADRHLPSVKSINRRKGAADSGVVPAPRSTDPQIPALLLSSRSVSKSVSNRSVWTLLLPWKCVKSFWYTLMYCPLSSGGRIRFGGIGEQRQLAFEAGLPWFPGDFPGTQGGWCWEARERERVKLEWDRKPKGKRTEWSSLDLGNDRKGELGKGWACDWEYLMDYTPKHNVGEEVTSKGKGGTNSEMSASEKRPVQLSALAFRWLFSQQGSSEVQGPDSLFTIITVKVTLLARGTASDRARIYRLPTNNTGLRKSWLLLSSSTKKLREVMESKRDGPDDKWHEVHRKGDTVTLSRKHTSLRSGDLQYPPVPDEVDLMGFITNGGYSLATGAGFGVGSISVDKVLGSPQQQGRSLCIVRESGQSIGRLAKWELAI